MYRKSIIGDSVLVSTAYFTILTLTVFTVRVISLLFGVNFPGASALGSSKGDILLRLGVVGAMTVTLSLSDFDFRNEDSILNTYILCNTTSNGYNILRRSSHRPPTALLFLSTFLSRMLRKAERKKQVYAINKENINRSQSTFLRVKKVSARALRVTQFWRPALCGIGGDVSVMGNMRKENSQKSSIWLCMIHCYYAITIGMSSLKRITRCCSYNALGLSLRVPSIWDCCLLTRDIGLVLTVCTGPLIQDFKFRRPGTVVC